MTNQIIAALAALAVAVGVLVVLRRIAHRVSTWPRLALALLGGASAGATWAFLSGRLQDLSWAGLSGAFLLVALVLTQEHFLMRRP